MPLYDYRCRSCDHEFDGLYTVENRHTPEQDPCPKCAEKGVVLQMRAPALCSAHRIEGTKSSQPQGDFKERMQQVKQHFKKDKYAKIPDF